MPLFFFAQIPSKWKLSLDPSSLCAPVPCWVVSHLLGALLGSLRPMCHICHICLSLPSWLSSALLSISSWGSSFHRLVFTVGRATYSVSFTYIFKNKIYFNWFGIFSFSCSFKWCLRWPQGYICAYRNVPPEQMWCDDVWWDLNQQVRTHFRIQRKKKSCSGREEEQGV